MPVECASNSDATTSTVEPWEQHWDEKRKKVYYFNSISKKSQWEPPKALLKKQPSPPPDPKQKLREPYQWSKVDDGKGKGKMIWYNSETGKRQYDLPACRMKYKP